MAIGQAGIERYCARILARAAVFACLLLPPAVLAENVTVACTVLPDETSASVTLTNPLKVEASCMANCKFSTAVYNDNPQIICAKPVAAGAQIEMCVLRSEGQKLLKLTESAADCRPK